MVAFTRRTHIVRISPDDPPSDTYIDVEVMDAISFRIEGNKEVIFNMDQTKAEPLIKDDTGGGHGKEPGQPTQRTHMTRVVNKDDATQKLDVEVIDCLAFRDQNGEEWILDMQNGSGDGASKSNISDGGGSSQSTRRVHTEIVTVPAGQKKSEAGADYITSIRSDNISFRRVRGEEVIVSCPSCDDTNAANVDFGRASTYVVSPKDYDPENDDGPTPPSLKDSGDKHNYVCTVDGADGFLTGDAKIDMGPFWWIRKVNQGKGILFVYISYAINSSISAPPVPSITLSHMSFKPEKTWDVLGSVNDTVPGATTTPAVVNPVTNAMLGVYNQWTVAPSFQKSSHGTTTGEQIYYVDGSNADVATDDFGEGFVTPVPTLDNYFKEVYFVPGASFPIVLTDVDPTPDPNPDHLTFDAHMNVLQARAPITNLSNNFSPEVKAALDPLNKYPTFAAASAAAAVINGAIDIVTGTHDVRPASVAGPLDVSTGGSRFAITGSAVFEVNLAKMKPVGGKYTAQIDIDFVGTGSVAAEAEVYKKLRDFTLDTTNVDDPNKPTFTPWDNEPPLPTKKDGGVFGTNSIISVAEGGSSGTLYFSIDAKTLDVNITTTPP